MSARDWVKVSPSDGLCPVTADAKGHRKRPLLFLLLRSLGSLGTSKARVSALVGAF